MRKSHIVLAGTAAGVAGVLSFPHGSHLVIPTSPAVGSGTTSTPTSPSTTPATVPPSIAGLGGDDGGGDDGTTGTAPVTTQPSPSSTPVTRTASGSTATGGTASYPYGQLSVKVTVQGKKITSVTLANLRDYDPRSAAIDNYAVPQLERQVIAASSASIQGVSGATFTSQAFVNSLVSALSKLGFK